MAATQVQLVVSHVSAAPLDYVVPGSLVAEPLAATAVFDGSAATGSWLPALEIYSDSGSLVSRAIVDTAVAAGGGAEVTFAPFLRPGGGGCCSSASSGYATMVNKTGPQAAWPLDETSGTTAHDETGNGHDLTETVFAGGSITWADATSPPGTVAPLWAGTNSGFFSVPAVALTPLADNFAVAAWVNYTSAVGGIYQIVGEGESPVRAGVVRGWSLLVQPGTPLVQVWFGDGAAAHSISANTNPLAGTWFHVGWQSDGGTKTLYVNGVKQTATSSVALSAAPANQWWIGYDFPFGLGSPSETYKGLMAWVVRWPRPLTSGEWAALAAGSGSLPAGWVLQSDGSGGSFYGPLPSDGAAAGTRLTADGSGGSYWA